MQIKAIETKYKGYRFRSRLEAKWAVFFDAFNWKWQYEPEGYKIEYKGKIIYYLPDFWLPDLKQFVEIKGGKISANDNIKIKALAFTSNYPVILLGNIPEQNECHDGFYGFYKNEDTIKEQKLLGEDAVSYCWYDPAYNCQDKYEAAIEKARQAQFEHGANGK
jgi:hypothetical protein